MPRTAAWRSGVTFLRGTNVHVPTALSAALHPRLRQTASYTPCMPLSLLFIYIIYYFNLRSARNYPLSNSTFNLLNSVSSKISNELLVANLIAFLHSSILRNSGKTILFPCRMYFFISATVVGIL